MDEEHEPIDEMGLAKEAKIELEIELGRPVSWEEFGELLASRNRVAAKTPNE